MDQIRGYEKTAQVPIVNARNALTCVMSQKWKKAHPLFYLLLKILSLSSKR